MKRTNILLLLFTFFFIQSHSFAQIDLFGDEDEETEFESFSKMKLDSIQNILNATGAVGLFPSNAISSFKMVNEGCEPTYICMYNTLKKVFTIAEYELNLKKIKLSCYETKVLLQDYALYLLTLNLDLYCIEHLHPDGNELKDVELINVMFAMGDVRVQLLYDTEAEDILPMLTTYVGIRDIADPYCSEDLTVINENTGSLPCDCGIYSGTMDTVEKNKLLNNLRTIIDDINPMWQAAKAVEINGRLKALPCK